MVDMNLAKARARAKVSPVAERKIALGPAGNLNEVDIMNKARAERAALFGAMIGKLAGFIKNKYDALRAELHERRMRRIALEELSGYSDRELADIGIARGEIRAAVYGKINLDRAANDDAANENDARAKGKCA